MSNENGNDTPLLEKIPESATDSTSLATTSTATGSAGAITDQNESNDERNIATDTNFQEQDIRELLRLSSSFESSTSTEPSTPQGSHNTSVLESNLTDPVLSTLSSRSSRLSRRRHARGCALPRRPTKQPCVSYCTCPKTGRDLVCKCGEEDTVFDWSWDESEKSEACELTDSNRTVMFHMNYSSGTAAVRGNQAMTDGQYFWEIKMTSPVYGTDMMVGIGTDVVKMDSFKHSFTSLLGRDGDSWGISYYGRLQQKGKMNTLSGAKFAQGSIVGVHADLWRGILTFYVNRKQLTMKCHGLQRKTLYPIVSSTAARTSMKIIKACSFKTSLQFLCCQTLRRIIPCDMDVLTAVDLPPGLRAFLANNLSWLFRPSELSSLSKKGSKRKRLQRDDDGENHPSTSKDPLATPSYFGNKRSRLPPPSVVDHSDTSSSSSSDREDASENMEAVSSSHNPGLFQAFVTSDESDEGGGDSIV